MAVLITTGYNETNAQRMAEYIMCIQRNVKSALFREIIMLIEGECKHFENLGIKLVRIGWRQTYGDMFNLANQYTDPYVVVANGDIFFDNTLKLLDKHDMSNRFYAISRKDLQSDERLSTPHNPCRSQDAWIFKPPLRKFFSDIPVAKPGCDQRVSWEAKNAGLLVRNPCFSINAIHMHRSKIRSYSWSRDRLPGPYLELPPCTL